MTLRRGAALAAAAAAVAVAGVVGVVGGATAGTAASCGTVTLNEQAWAGSTANTYVAKAALEKIGCKIKITKITEIPVYQAMADGKTDAVLEDWQHVAQYKQYQLSEVLLPKRFKGCQDDAKAGGSVAKYKCAYDKIVLNKVFSKKFANSGSPAYAALKRFKWTNSDQETVAKWIAGDHLNPDKAGKKWVDSHTATVNKWLGK